MFSLAEDVAERIVDARYLNNKDIMRPIIEVVLNANSTVEPLICTLEAVLYTEFKGN